MTQRFVASTLKKAYRLATKTFNTSVLNLDIKIIQNSRKGLFSFFKKKSIIEVSLKKVNNEMIDMEQTQYKTKKLNIKKIFNSNKITSTSTQTVITENMINNIKIKINNLFNSSCFNLDKIHVELIYEQYAYINIQGKDSDLLIGEHEEVYNSLLHILSNYVYLKYKIKTILEIGTFLNNQEKNIKKYITTIANQIENENENDFKTKIFSSAITKIALRLFRQIYPTKYIVSKRNDDGENYILIHKNKKFNK